MTEDHKKKVENSYMKDMKKTYRETSLSGDKQKKIMKRSKWGARLATAFHAIGIVVILTFVTTMLTFFYYHSQSPIPIKQGEKLERLIDYTYMITDPYGFLGTTSLDEGRYFTLNATRNHVRMVGNREEKVGETEIRFLFSFMWGPKEREFVNRDTFAFSNKDHGSKSSAWDQLERLPEGTVATAYLSLSEKQSTEKVIDLLGDKDLRLLWLPLDLKDKKYNSQQIGFPTFISQNTKHEEGVDVAKYSQEHFLEAIDYLKKHERKVNQLTEFDLDLGQIEQEVHDEGFYHRGAVVTGPSKELLSLKEEGWVEGLVIDGIDFWNWE